MKKIFLAIAAALIFFGIVACGQPILKNAVTSQTPTATPIPIPSCGVPKLPPDQGNLTKSDVTVQIKEKWVLFSLSVDQKSVEVFQLFDDGHNKLLGKITIAHTPITLIGLGIDDHGSLCDVQMILLRTNDGSIFMDFE